jgi:hypothetical protein
MTHPAPNTLVIVEWYTTNRIPRQHHAIVTSYAQAEAWMRMNLQITVTEIWEDILYERH